MEGATKTIEVEVIIPKMTKIQAEIGLSPGALLKELKQRMNRNISRTSLFRWRKHLNMACPPYYEDDINALEIYGSLLSVGVDPESAKIKTLAEIIKN